MWSVFVKINVQVTPEIESTMKSTTFEPELLGTTSKYFINEKSAIIVGSFEFSSMQCCAAIFICNNKFRTRNWHLDLETLQHQYRSSPQQAIKLNNTYTTPLHQLLVMPFFKILDQICEVLWILWAGTFSKSGMAFLCTDGPWAVPVYWVNHWCSSTYTSLQHTGVLAQISASSCC